MAMFRGLPPFIEPIDSDKKDKGEKIKYWRLREILPSGFTSQDNPSFSQLLIWKSTSHFQLQNNYWSLTAHINVIDYGYSTLTIKLHREYNPSCYANATHAFAEPRNSLADLFTVLIGIVGESGEIAVEKAKPLGRFGFEVYRLIDEAELHSILKSKAPYFLFVEIETKDITEEKQKARERKKERKNYRCQRFENALRICNETLSDPVFSNASPPAVMRPPMTLPSVAKQAPKYLTPSPLDPSLNSSLPTSSNASTAATTTTAMFPTGAALDRCERFGNALRICNGTLTDTDSSNAFPPAMMGRSVMRPPTMTSPPGMRPPTMPLPSVIKETPKYVTPSPLDPSLNSSLPTSSTASTTATRTTTMFPSKSVSSAVNGTPTFVFPNPTPSTPMISAVNEIPTFVFPNPSFPNSTPSLPARPPNPSLPTSNISHSFSSQLEEEQVPNDQAQSLEHDILELDPATFLERYLSTTTTPGLFPSIKIPSAIKETSPSLNTSLFKSPASLPARPPNPSLPTTKTRNFQMDYKDLLLSGKGSDFTITVKDMKFHAHKLILGTRSSVFLAMTEPELTITDVDPAIFREFLLYLYTGCEEHIDWKNIMELYKLGDKYCVVDLKELCLERMKCLTRTRKFQMDYKDLLLSGKGSDFTIIVKDMKFHAHKLILGTRSSVFLAMTEPELTITDVDPVIFREFLLYLYTGSEEHIDWKNIMELYKLGDKFCLVDFKELCLERMKTNLSMENFFEIFMLSWQPNNRELTEATIQFFLENSKEIIESDRYKDFMHDYPDEGNNLNILAVYASYKFLVNALEAYRKAK